MPFSISFVNPEKYSPAEMKEFTSQGTSPPPHWDKSLTKDEFDEVKNLCSSRCNIYVIPASFIPVRTDNAKNFCKDVFLPTFFNQALKVRSAAAKCFAILFSLILDIATLPIRLLTAGPWILINRKVCKKEEHPLHRYLTEQNVDREHLRAEHLRIKLTWEEDSEHEEPPQTKSIERWQEFNVNFIRTPVHEDFDFFLEGSRSLNAKF
jgi:hypothetical protein